MLPFSFFGLNKVTVLSQFLHYITILNSACAYFVILFKIGDKRKELKTNRTILSGILVV